MNPVFSFLVANYNTRPFAKEMLQSMAGQTFSSWEAIIVDDCSKDGGIGDLIREMRDERFKYIELDKNMGASHARNVGFKECRGQYIVIVDSDDMLMPEYLQEMNKAFAQNKNASLAYVDLEYFGSLNMIVEMPLKDAEALSLGQWIPHGGSCIAREIFEKSGGYYEGVELRHGNLDWDFFLSIAQNAPLNVIRVPKPLYRYRQHGKNMTRSRAPREYITRECMYRRHKEFFERHGHEKTFLATGYYESAAGYWARGEYGEAIRLAALGAKFKPLALPTLPSLVPGTAPPGRVIAEHETRLKKLGADAYSPTEENFNAHQFLVQAYAGLKQWDKSRNRTYMELGMALGNDILSLAAQFAVQLALICRQEGSEKEAKESAELALLCNPYNAEALTLNINFAFEAGRPNQALQYLKPWIQVKNLDILKKIVPVFASIAKFTQLDFDKIKNRLQEIARTGNAKNEPDFRQKIYASPLGRRVIWEYRAKDLFEKYGNNEGGHASLKQAVERADAKKVLEIGCGNGRNLAFLSRLGLNCVGQDISSCAITLARQKNLPNVKWYDQPLNELDFEADSFDLVISNRVLQHVAPGEMGSLLDIMTKIGKFIYVNESLPNDEVEENWYLKKYDVLPELEKRGFRLLEKYENSRSETAMLFTRNTVGI